MAEDIVGNIAEDFVGTEDTLREGVPGDEVTVWSVKGEMWLQ